MVSINPELAEEIGEELDTIWHNLPNEDVDYLNDREF
jgi:hypothetical protein